MKRILENTLALSVLAIAISAIAYVSALELDKPLVSFDYYTKECVKVESPSDNFDCSNYPERHHHQWVNQSRKWEYRYGETLTRKSN